MRYRQQFGRTVEAFVVRLGFLMAIALVWLCGISTAAAPDTRELNSVLRFCDSSTLAVLRVDVQQEDAKSVPQWASKVLRAGGATDADVPQMQERLRGWIARHENWKAGFTRAGGRVIYSVIRQPIMLNPPYLLVPLSTGADAEQIAAQLEASEILKPGSQQLPETRPTTEKDRQILEELEKRQRIAARRIGDAVVYGTEWTLEGLAKAKPDADGGTVWREALGAFDTPAAVEIVANREGTRAAEGFVALFFHRGSEALDHQVEHTRWISVGFRIPPTSGVTAIVKAETAEEADSLRRFFLSLRTSAATRPAFAGAAHAIQPEVRGDRVLLTLDEQQVDKLLASTYRAVTESKSPAGTQPTTTSQAFDTQAGRAAHD